MAKKLKVPKAVNMLPEDIVIMRFDGRLELELFDEAKKCLNQQRNSTTPTRLIARQAYNNYIFSKYGRQGEDFPFTTQN